MEATPPASRSSAFLYGLAAEDLRQEELEHRDPDYEVVITARAVKQARLRSRGL